MFSDHEIILIHSALDDTIRKMKESLIDNDDQEDIEFLTNCIEDQNKIIKKIEQTYKHIRFVKVIS